MSGRNRPRSRTGLNVDPDGWFEDRGVSPVVGAAILIGITVVLASILATFVLSLGTNQAEAPPSTELSVTQESVNKGLDPMNVTRRGVLQVRVEHTAGEDVQQQNVQMKLLAESNTRRVDGFLLYYNTDQRFNVTSPEWNSIDDRRLSAGDTARFDLFVTDQTGRDEGVTTKNNVDDLWKSSNCHVEVFNNNRIDEGDINISGTVPPYENGSVDNCPIGGNNATIPSGDIEEGGRIAANDTVRIVWNPISTDTSTILERYGVRDR